MSGVLGTLAFVALLIVVVAVGFMAFGCHLLRRIARITTDSTPTRRERP